MKEPRGLYLGREVAPGAAEAGPRLELDPTDLLTHAFIVGMTGSGKTGLGIGLIEEVLRQGIPVIAIDPKGDLGNLLLLFDDLSPGSFGPWLDPEAVRRGGTTAQAAAEEAAAAWKAGLAEWGLGPADVASLRRSRDALILTPGSSSGVGLDVLQSLEAPPGGFDEAEEELRDEIADLVSGILGLLHLPSDPLQSREHILLATLIEANWREGKGLNLETLIQAVAEPGLEKLGALPLETVYPRKERQQLMMALNSLLASPSFEDWREGMPLEVESLLRDPGGRPRLSIVYTAHLSDDERFFVTALVLDKLKTWMRRQPGTSSLRALLYMDEIYGYLPPHPANPPTKRPLLSLLKQARAQGVAVVLATQNPVDLDYKGLANIGTWMIGTLQTSRDRERLRDGLEAADRSPGSVEALLDGTRKRVFLLHDVHRSGPGLFHTRWALSYLRGPLTREEVSRLMRERASEAPAPVGETSPAPPTTGTPERETSAPAGPPVAPVGLRHHFLQHFGGELADPYLLVKYAVRYKDSGEVTGIRGYPLTAGAETEVLEAEPVEIDEAQLSERPPTGVRYGELPAWVETEGGRGLERAVKARLADKLVVTAWEDPLIRETSRPGESREAFLERLRAGGGGPEAEKLRDRIERKKRDLGAREQDLAGRKTEKWAAIGSALLSNIGLLTGRKRRISGASSVLTKNRLENSAEARVEALQAEVADLEADLKRLTEVDPARLQEKRLVPARSAVKLLRYDLVWIF